MGSDQPEAGRHQGTLVWRFGDAVREREEWRGESGWNPENLRKPGFSPATIVDVGVAHGTPLLYEAFPEARLVLIEPLVEFESSLERTLGRRRGEHLATAVGLHDGMVTMNVDTQDPRMSSIVPPADEPGRPLEAREVPITTLDVLLEQRGWSPPFGLKVDVGGFEHHVLRGSTKFLEETQFVIAKVSVERKVKASYRFEDLIRLMDSCGFSLRDILDAHKPQVAGVIESVDGLFRRNPPRPKP